MKNQFSRLEISDYRTLLKYCVKSDIVKIVATGPDLLATTAQIRRDMAAIASPAIVLVSVIVPSAEDAVPDDMVELLTVVVATCDNAPTVIWGVKEMPERCDVQINIYMAVNPSHPVLAREQHLAKNK